MHVDVRKLFDAGVALAQAEHAAGEAAKVGTLRAGNTGCIAPLSPSGAGGQQVIGKCPRMSLLRMMGIDADVTPDSREHMFAGGRANEEIWADVLGRTWPGHILREEQIPISWTVPVGGNQVTVSGRPDLVLCDRDFKPIKGLELKQVSSLWTARDVGFELTPKTQHLLQAAHYSWKLGVPFDIWYASRADFAVMGFAVKLFAKVGLEMQDRIEFAHYKVWYDTETDEETGRTRKVRKTKGVTQAEFDRLPPQDRAFEPKKVLPFIQGFELQWNPKGQLQWRALPRDGSEPGAWNFTLITTAGIEQYYQMVAGAQSSGKLPPRPANVEADGSKMSYEHCTYCPLHKAGVCHQNEAKGLDGWLTAVRGHLEGPK